VRGGGPVADEDEGEAMTFDGEEKPVEWRIEALRRKETQGNVRKEA